VAVIVPRKGAQLDGLKILESLKARLANFKVPERCYVVDSLPRNAMGKVQKKLLRDQYQQEFS
ncbi:MAG: malonyl-CoA synthase, partial [Comamonas sp.]